MSMHARVNLYLLVLVVKPILFSCVRGCVHLYWVSSWVVRQFNPFNSNCKLMGLLRKLWGII
jgi:hypothetical protein